jgi:hypothetical protein
MNHFTVYTVETAPAASRPLLESEDDENAS